MESILGLGHDVVDVTAFDAQLAEPGSRMRGLFSPRELRQAALRAQKKQDGEAVHLAARWAGKEAVLKAWCEALGDAPNPYTLDDFPWSAVEILDDSRGRPQIVLSAVIQQTLTSSVTAGIMPETMAVHTMSGAADNAVEDPAGNVAGGSPSDGVDTAAGNTPSGSPDVPVAFRWHVSLSHDGSIASAVVLLMALAEHR